MDELRERIARAAADSQNVPAQEELASRLRSMGTEDRADIADALEDAATAIERLVQENAELRAQADDLAKFLIDCGIAERSAVRAAGGDGS